MRLIHSRAAIAFALFAVATATTAVAAGKTPAKAAIKPAPAPSAPVPAPSRVVAGVSLGESFALKECPTVERYKRLGPQYVPEFDIGAAAPCFKTGYLGPSKTPANLWDGTLTVVTADLPFGFDRSYQRATLINGKIEGLTMSTRGLKVQDDVLSALTEKFGTPSKLDSSKVQNRMGAEFVQIDATWKFSDLTVTFIGMGSTIDSGMIVIETPVAEERSLQEQAAKKAAAPKL